MIGLAGNTRWTTTAQTGVQIRDMTNGSFPPRNVFKDKKICSIHKVQTQAMISGPVIALLYTNNETARNAVQFFPNQERRICWLLKGSLLQCHVNALLTREWTVLKFTGSQLDGCVTISKGPKAVDSGCKLDNI